MRTGLRELCVSGLLLVAAVTGCGAPHVEGSGQQIQKELQPFDFETLNVNDGIEVTVVVDPDQPRQARLVGDGNLVALVRAEKSGTTGLFVYLPPEEVASWSSSNPLRLEVTMPKLLAISRTGGGTVDVSGRVTAPEFFTISALGGGTVKVRGLDTESFNLNMDGGGDVTVEGRATQVTSTLSGGEQAAGARARGPGGHDLLQRRLHGDAGVSRAEREHLWRRDGAHPGQPGGDAQAAQRRLDAHLRIVGRARSRRI
jgi:hypothetical protein